MSKLAEVWYEMLDLRLQHVSSRVPGFPLASQCLWGKLQKHVFFKVSQDVVMSFRVAVVHFVTFPVCQKACVCVCTTIVAEKSPCLWRKLKKLIFFKV